MARLFDDASSHYLEESTAAVVTAVPLTMACWFRSNDAAASQDLISLSNPGSTINFFRLNAGGNAAGDPVRAIVGNGSSAGIAASTTGFTANVWAHACAVFTSATSRDAYINGGSKGSETTNLTPSSLARTTVGAVNVFGGRTAYMSGDIAEAAIWSAALDAAEIAALAKGYSPAVIRPASLVSYWPIIGRWSTEIDVRGVAPLTVSGATVSDHPRILHPRSHRRVGVAGAAAAGGGNRLVDGGLIAGRLMGGRLAA